MKGLALIRVSRDACSSARLVSVEAGNVSERGFQPTEQKIFAATQTDWVRTDSRSSSLTTPAGPVRSLWAMCQTH